MKALAFDEGVNVTLGLPFVRTSPTTARPSTSPDAGSPGSTASPPRCGWRRASPPPDPMSAIDDLPPLRDVIGRHDLMAKKSLGQNFLLDLNLTARIARASARSRA